MSEGGFGRKGIAAGAAQPALSNAGFGNGLDQLRNRQTIPPNRVEPASRQTDLPSEKAVEEYNYSSGFGRAKPQKSLLLAYVLWWFAGAISAHRFYLGAFQSACVQLGFFVFGLAFVFMGEPWAFLGAFLFVVWAIWILADVFFTYRVHSKLSAQGSIEYSQHFR